MEVLREYEQDGYKIIEYTKNGKDISHKTKTIIQNEVPEETQDTETPIEEIQLQTLLNTEYLVNMTKINNI